MDTIWLLAKVAQDVSWKAKNGNIDATLTYKEFITRVKKLGEELGDAPTEREHQNPAPPVVVNAERIPEASTNSNSFNDYDNDTFSPHRLDDGVPNSSPSKQETKCSGVPPTAAAPQEENGEGYADLKKMSLAKLKDRCKERDEKNWREEGRAYRAAAQAPRAVYSDHACPVSACCLLRRFVLALE